MTAISLRNISKAYGEHPPVLRDVNLDIGEHEFCVFLGPSGCGKSTLLRLIAGLEDVSGGELKIGGQRVNEVQPAARGVAMVFQSYALFPHMSVFDNIAFGLRISKVSNDEIRRRVNEAARVLQIESLLDRKPRALSGGQRQRVAIGRAIVREPKAFLFDEPLSNLDATLRAQTRIEIGRLHNRFEQASSVYVTHDQVEAMTLADKIVLLRAGEEMTRFGSIAQIGSPLDLYHRPANLFAAGFIGSPRMNFLPGRVVTTSPSRVDVKLDDSDEVIALTERHVEASLQTGARITFGVRPEHLTLTEPQAAGVARSGLQREVAFSEQLGEVTYVHLDTRSERPLIAKAPGSSVVRAGERQVFFITPGSAHLFDENGDAVAAARQVSFH
ncbi:ABC transporter ATP-binding protein [Paraburkholderia sp. DHOC27]|uniref:ABC transporter ATP-binding protein n=1 Tax=Paraburkholderia sp. DHOC27 TaxID=2303330 RepID=UPI000E3ED752|nr:sn-glycerol-3-phosphate ABC transporter ATP-binding protein UgpC [Paraburkholderia sp. DHOC27]RFU45179.1 sn-glycerol-3-phosphate ABC transporter ATP-binding protein UgpC [Paraburkholderia sp. DHOC27]